MKDPYLYEGSGVLINLFKMAGTLWGMFHEDEKTERFSRYMAELWKVHPFREGNTRTIRTGSK
ncbi:MAG: Fic family protein [Tannerella sp.]|jgi:cell filamentation protein|nr:Fic family protein [Tannerella sp.]